TGIFETALEPAEIVTAVRFPKPQAACYQKFRNPASRYAIVGVFVARTSGVRVAVAGAGPVVFRVPEMEAALARSFTPDAIKDITIKEDGLNSDIHASAEYRAHLVGVMARRAVAGCA
ncbi:MAG: carbon monoxide dehydrogenase, partial [Candidatus Eremiobacteraeota bacterium]|nr:carbon monoxide dehydrogenase [Candidatus Eremiobacteraeota bacterium]